MFGLHSKQGFVLGTSVASHNARPRGVQRFAVIVPLVQGHVAQDALKGTVASSRQFVVGILKQKFHGPLFGCHLVFRKTRQRDTHVSLVGLDASRVLVALLIVGMVLVRGKVQGHRRDHRG